MESQRNNRIGNSACFVHVLFLTVAFLFRSAGVLSPVPNAVFQPPGAFCGSQSTAQHRCFLMIVKFLLICPDFYLPVLKRRHQLTFLVPPHFLLLLRKMTLKTRLVSQTALAWPRVDGFRQGILFHATYRRPKFLHHLMRSRRTTKKCLCYPRTVQLKLRIPFRPQPHLQKQLL